MAFIISKRRPMPRELRDLLIVSLCAALFSLAIIYIGGDPRSNSLKRDFSLQKVFNAGRLVFGFDAYFPPMSFIDDKGEFSGFDIDMMREVSKRLGVEFIMQSIDWEKKENELNDGIIDCIGSISVVPETLMKMSLSEAYLKEDLIFVIRSDSKVKWLRDLKGKNIGVQAGSTTQKLFNKTDIRDDTIVALFDDNMTILQHLKEGKLDAGLVDSLVACYFIFSDSERYFVLPDSLGEEKFAIAFRKGDLRLRERVQEIISGMKADGTLGEISKKWFGSNITIVR